MQLSAVVTICLVLLPISVSADEKEAAIKADAEYRMAWRGGVEVFSLHLNKNRRAIDTVLLLEACKQKALASTVREKISDAKLYSAVEDVVEKTPELSKTPFRSRFDVLLAASAMLSGYKVGVVRGLEVTMAVPAAQKGACRAAIEEAEEIVKR